MCYGITDREGRQAPSWQRGPRSTIAWAASRVHGLRLPAQSGGAGWLDGEFRQRFSSGWGRVEGGDRIPKGSHRRSQWHPVMIVRHGRGTVAYSFRISSNLSLSLCGAYRCGTVRGMSDSNEDDVLVARIRSGDDEAARLFWERHHKHLKLRARRWLRARRAPVVIGESDVCLVAMVQFFQKVADGSFVFQSAQQLQHFLDTLTYGVTRDMVRFEHRQRRDSARTEPLPLDFDAPSPLPTPQLAVADKELIDQALGTLPQDDRLIVETGIYGRSWSELAKRLGKTAGGLRMRFGRLVRQLARRFGRDESGPW